MAGKAIIASLLLMVLSVTPECNPMQDGYAGGQDGIQGALCLDTAQVQDQDYFSPSGAISPRIGLCTDLLYMSPSKRGEMIEKLRPLGQRVIRETFRWNLIELKKGRFDWSGPDALVDDINGSGLEILAILMAAPAWAGGSNLKIGSYPPDSPEDYARFVEAVVKRYKGRIRYYELWNEPNIPRFWGGRRAEPEEFVALLKAGYKAGKKADPEAVFVMGGVTKLIVDKAFMKDVIRLDGLDECDAVGVHLYPESFERFRGIMLALTGAIQKAGSTKPVWITEVGWASRELDIMKYLAILAERGITREQARKSVALRRAIGHVYDFTEEEQRKALDTDALKEELNGLGLTEDSLDSIIRSSALDRERKQAEAIWKLSGFLKGQRKVERIFWYRLDDRHDSPVKEANFGLIDVNGAFKTAYRVLEGRVRPAAGGSDIQGSDR